jgi:hypothetical protein
MPSVMVKNNLAGTEIVPQPSFAYYVAVERGLDLD